MICYNLPVFFINDEEKLMALFDAFSNRTPFDGINEQRLWRFAVDNPETVNCILRLFSYRGISDSFIDQEWYAPSTYVWENSCGKRHLARCSWIPLIGGGGKSAFRRDASGSLDRAAAEFLAGFDPDIASAELYRSIEEGDFPSFELRAQIVDYKYASHPNYLKQTLMWNERITAPTAIGMLKLTDIVTGAEAEAMSFAPGNLTDGIGLCADGLSQAMDYMYRAECMRRGGRL